MPTQTQCPRKYQELHYVCSYSWHGSWPVPSIKAPQWEDNKPIQQALHILIGWCEIILAQDLPCFTDPQPSLSTLLLGAHSLFIVSVMSHQRTETKNQSAFLMESLHYHLKPVHFLSTNARSMSPAPHEYATAWHWHCHLRNEEVTCHGFLTGSMAHYQRSEQV